MVSPQTMKCMDDFISVGIVEHIGKDKYRISKEWYIEGMEYLSWAVTEHPTFSKFEQYNTAMGRAMIDRIGYIPDDDILDEYLQALMTCFINAGIYDELFGDVWRDYLDESGK